MNSGRVAIRYARALFKFANEQGLADAFYADAKTLIRALDSDELRELTRNPLVTPDQKADVMKKVVAQMANPAFSEFIGILFRKGRADSLLNALLLFRDLYRSEKGIVSVQVEIANHLSNKELSEIDRLVQAHFQKKTELTVSVKPELIAGFILVVDGKIMDYSVTGQLLQFRKSFGIPQPN